MIFFTASAAVMFSGMPELCPSPWPGAPWIIGSCHATPGFCDACGMQSMSEPSAITGLPEPQLAIHAVGIPARFSCTVKPFFLRMSVRYLRRLELLEAELAEAEHLVDHLLREDRHVVDVGRHFLLVAFELRRQSPPALARPAWPAAGFAPPCARSAGSRQADAALSAAAFVHDRDICIGLLNVLDYMMRRCRAGGP